MSVRPALVALFVLATSCAGKGERRPNQPVAPLSATLHSLSPRIVVPGTRLALVTSNVTLQATHELHIEGIYDGQRMVKLLIPVVVDGGALYGQTGDLLVRQGEGQLVGRAWLVSSNAYGTAVGPAVPVSLQVKRELVPSIVSVGEGIVFLNSDVVVNGTNMLLGGQEGQTKVELHGCFVDGITTRAQCEANDAAVDVAIDVSAVTRSRGTFRFIPEIGGIHPGRFIGSVTLANYRPAGLANRSTLLDTTFDMLESRLSGFDQPAVSMGQLLDVRGEGFAGGDSGQTVLEFEGTFRMSDGQTREVSLAAVAGFVDGTRVQLVVERGIGFGEAIDLDTERGTLEGTWTPVIIWKDQRRAGRPASVALQIAPVKQVVWVRFLDSFRESLKSYGLQAAEVEIRARVLAVIRRTYLGLNVELREEQPQDFKLYAVLDIAGDDPNGLDLFGYDNTPGKDIGNQRLFDHIGGVNALTQQDGFPGYGGVFIHSLFSLSQHPPAGINKNAMASPNFDAIFDPFRSDVGGNPASSAEIAAAPKLTSARICPASERPDRVACAIRVLGNLVGSTAAHELGHTFGLADPYGSPTVYHNFGDKPNRLMEAGGDRPFNERAEILGEGPAVFCEDEFRYLQRILPTELADPEPSRPSCD